MQSLTGLVILFFGGCILLVVMAFIYRKRVFAISLCIIFVTAGIIGGVYANRVYDKLFTIHPIDKQHLQKFTPRGRRYTFEFNNSLIENGNQVMVYCCWWELDSVWKTRSKLSLDTGKDVNGNPISITLVRYLASKVVRKNNRQVK